jgi:hypothetical protein
MQIPFDALSLRRLTARITIRYGAAIAAEPSAGHRMTGKAEASMADKAEYTTPVVTDWGTVTDLTQTGRSRPGGDAKSGSVMSRGR